MPVVSRHTENLQKKLNIFQNFPKTSGAENLIRIQMITFDKLKICSNTVKCQLTSGDKKEQLILFL